MIKCNKGECVNEAVNFDGCCFVCPAKADCADKCSDDPKECGEAVEIGTAVQIVHAQAITVLNGIADCLQRKAEYEAAEKDLRESLTAIMEKYGVTKLDHDLLKINYIAPTTRTSVDSPKLKETYPHIYAECSKTSNVKGYVKIELKGDKKK